MSSTVDYSFSWRLDIFSKMFGANSNGLSLQACAHSPMAMYGVACLVSVRDGEL